jgi:YkoY family integral membrane protein
MLTTLSIIFSIAILELMLSVDNALVNASLAEELPEKLQKKAIYIGIALGAIFRFLCLFVATIIIQNPFIKVLGALYLLWLAYAHFFRSKKEERELKRHPHFRVVIAQIALADLVFSIDNIVGAIGISSNYVFVVFGVFIGITTMIIITPLMLRLMHIFPSLIKTAYGIIAYIGLAILFEVFTHTHIPEYLTFAFILTAVLITMWHDRKKQHLFKV